MSKFRVHVTKGLFFYAGRARYINEYGNVTIELRYGRTFEEAARRTHKAVLKARKHVARKSRNFLYDD